MSDDDGTEPIADDELIYRRVPKSCDWYSVENGLSPEAFNPNKRDDTGISVSRAKYKTVDEAGMGWPGKSYYVAVLRADDLRRCNIAVLPKPLPLEGDLGHAELPNLRYENRRSTEALETKLQLRDLCLRVEGPFDTPES